MLRERSPTGVVDFGIFTPFRPLVFDDCSEDNSPANIDEVTSRNQVDGAIYAPSLRPNK